MAMRITQFPHLKVVKPSEKVKLEVIFRNPNPVKPAEIMDGMALVRDVKSNGMIPPYYAELSDMKTGKLKGLIEGDYLLLEKDGNIIERTQKLDLNTDTLCKKITDVYETVTDKTGKLQSLSERNKNGRYTLTQNPKGELVETRTGLFEEQLKTRENTLNSKDFLELVKQVEKHNGESLKLVDYTV